MDYDGARTVYGYRSCLHLILRFGGTRKYFFTSENHSLVHLSKKNGLSDVNKTYIDISNGQKFELKNQDQESSRLLKFFKATKK